jgi:uncharacterized sulfatase
LIDLYPTLCDRVGMEPRHPLSGTSLEPQLQNPALPAKKAEITQGNPDGASIRTDHYRYTEWDNGEKGAMLYDLKTDPNEFTNLAGRPEARNITRQLQAELHAFMVPSNP